MAKYSIEDSTLSYIADAIRAKEGSSDLIPVIEMGDRIHEIATGSTVLVSAPNGAEVHLENANWSTGVGLASTDGEVGDKFTLWRFTNLENGIWYAVVTYNGETQRQIISIENTYAVSFTFGAQYAANFADNDWATIISACQKNEVPSTWAVGDSKPMTIYGSDYDIRIAGKSHDTYTDGGLAPITFEMVRCYGQAESFDADDSRHWTMDEDGTNVGGISVTDLYINTLPRIKALMPGYVQDAIKKVDKLCGVGGGSTEVVVVSSDLFLPSAVELLGDAIMWSSADEGVQYEYYALGNSAAKQNTADTLVAYWTRSPTINFPSTAYNSSHFSSISTAGKVSPANANSGSGLSFMFCF